MSAARAPKAPAKAAKACWALVDHEGRPIFVRPTRAYAKAALGSLGIPPGWTIVRYVPAPVLPAPRAKVKR